MRRDRALFRPRRRTAASTARSASITSRTTRSNSQLEDYARDYPFSYSSEEIPDLSRSIERQYLDRDRDIDRWARQFLRKQGPTGTRELLAAMTHAINERFTYVARTEIGTQDPVVTLRLGSGSCRDFALLMMEAVRSLGLAARFVSGYLVPSGPDRQQAARRRVAPMPGWRSICPAPAGSNTTRPTASSATRI